MNTLTLHNESKLQTKNIVAALLCCMMLICFLSLAANPAIAFCTEGEGNVDAGAAISQAINQVAAKIYTTMRQIITPAVIVAFAFAGFQFILGGSQGPEKARKYIIGGLVAMVLVIFAPLFGQAVALWFAAFGGGDLSQFNPLA